MQIEMPPCHGTYRQQLWLIEEEKCVLKFYLCPQIKSALCCYLQVTSSVEERKYKSSGSCTQ